MRSGNSSALCLVLSLAIFCFVAAPALAQSEHGWTEKPGNGNGEEPPSDGIIWQGRGGDGGPDTDTYPWVEPPGGNGGGNGHGDPDADSYPWGEEGPLKCQGNPGDWDLYPWGEDPPKCQGNPGGWDAVLWMQILLNTGLY